MTNHLVVEKKRNMFFIIFHFLWKMKWNIFLLRANKKSNREKCTDEKMHEKSNIDKDGAGDRNRSTWSSVTFRSIFIRIGRSTAFRMAIFNMIENESRRWKLTKFSRDEIESNRAAQRKSYVNRKQRNEWKRKWKCLKRWCVSTVLFIFMFALDDRNWIMNRLYFSDCLWLTIIFFFFFCFSFSLVIGRRLGSNSIFNQEKFLEKNVSLFSLINF